jgi:6-phospho-beta-glucosidase
MRLTVLGGGGFRVPLVYSALLADREPGRIDEVVLHDVDAARLVAIQRVLVQLAQGVPDAPVVSAETDLDRALEGADFVFSAIRVGGSAGRIRDERTALDLGVLGQETTGPGGLAFALRTVPVAVDIALRVARYAPDAWLINFTNPAGVVTEAMQQVLGDRAIGICDSAIALGRRCAAAVLADPEQVHLDYVGLNHLGWLRGLHHGGRDLLPDLLADDVALAGIEESRLIGLDLVRALGAIPNEYLYYYYRNREAVAAITASPQTRGEFLHRQQEQFYARVTASPHTALQTWRQVRAEREATYMAESRSGGDVGRDAADLTSGGYEAVALALMHAIGRNRRASLILDVRNGTAVPGLPPEAVVEVPCTVDATGPRPLATGPVTGHQLGLMQQVKEVEQAIIGAALTGSRALALKAFALHPLVGSVRVARALVEGYLGPAPTRAVGVHRAG